MGPLINICVTNEAVEIGFLYSSVHQSYDVYASMPEHVPGHMSISYQVALLGSPASTLCSFPIVIARSKTANAL